MVAKKGEPEVDWPYDEPEVPALPAPYQLRSERAQVTEKEEVGEAHTLTWRRDMAWMITEIEPWLN